MPVTKAKWGTKLTCQNCGAKFYDMKKKQPVCPKCETEYVPEKSKTRRATAAAPATEAAPKPSPETTESTEGNEVILETDLEDDILEDDSESGDNSVMEDTSDIGGDEDDIGEVISSVDGSDGEGDGNS